MPAKETILLVDDDHDVVNYLKLVGKLIEVHISVAYTYKEAMEKISLTPFASYIIDINLPDGNGVELVEFIRNKFHAVKIALLSNFKSNEDANRFKKNVAVDYLVRKPVNDRELKKLFHDLIKEKKTDKNDPNDLLAELKREYENSVDEKLQNMEEILSRTAKDPSVENFIEFKMAVHKIAGSAGTFGFHEASKICLELDRKLQPKKDATNLSAFFASNLLNSFLPKLHKSFSSRRCNEIYIPVSLLNKQLKIIKEAYAENLLKKIEDIFNIWEEAKQGKKSKIHDLFFMINNLAGSAGSFDFPSVSECASEIYERLDKNSSLNDKISLEIQTLLLNLKKCSTEALDAFSTTSKTAKKEINTNFCLIFTMLKNSEEIEGLQNFTDYTVNNFATYHELDSALNKQIPFVILVDQSYSQNSDVLDNLALIRMNIPIVFVINEHEFPFYLSAIRSGINDFLIRPVLQERFIEKISKFSQERIYEPFGVLIVDDDLALAENYALILRKAGMDSKVINDPATVLQALESFIPDVMLFDVNMPFCSGIELASVIKQYEYFRDIPIIFLSTEKNFDKQLAAMEQGEAFLQKPIQPEQLVAAAQKWGQQSLRTQAIKQTLRKYDEKANETQLLHELRQERIKRKRLEEAVGTLQREMDALYKMHSEKKMMAGTILNGNSGESYTILKVMASGGMGITYLATRKSNLQKVVIKTLSAEYQKNQKEALRFYNESQCLMEIDHLNLVRGYDYYHGQSLCFVVMEYVQGKTVDNIITEQGLFEVKNATKIICHVAQALVYLETCKIIHRDIKPQNIIIGDNDITKLVDFGIAKTETGKKMSMTTTDIVLGTPYYLSPEQLCSREVDIRSDIFSLGATYFHMVTGQLPFNGRTTLEVMHKRLVYSPNPQEFNSALPNDITKIIEKMMKIDVNKRYSSATKLLIDLENMLKSMEN
ncbi:response regulator [Candidatus Uabimicrobium sp. HlEnr_7]|uniref:protein kinase domain-containing protein n=1 Tax=Candidatus Uabimicrobium helgolandensis TaxID=3095367 RepID=UPI0035581046